MDARGAVVAGVQNLKPSHLEGGLGDTALKFNDRDMISSKWRSRPLDNLWNL